MTSTSEDVMKRAKEAAQKFLGMAPCYPEQFQLQDAIARAILTDREARSGWRDIASLTPEDGMIVVGYGEYRERDGFSPAFMRWHAVLNGWTVTGMPFYPTHWMPIPAAPSASPSPSREETETRDTSALLLEAEKARDDLFDCGGDESCLNPFGVHWDKTGRACELVNADARAEAKALDEWCMAEMAKMEGDTPSPQPNLSGLDEATKQKLREALRFSASRSVMTAEDERRILSALETTAPVQHLKADPDYCFDPDDWEFTCHWADRDEVHGHGDALKLGDPMRVCTLVKGPDKWVADVPIEWDDEGDVLETEIRWFDTEADARSALAREGKA